MKVLLLGEQGTGKPLFARLLAKQLSELSEVQVRIKDLDLEPVNKDDGHTIYLKDSICPDVPTIPITFFDLVIVLPKQFEDTMHELHKFNAPLQREIANTLISMRGEIKPFYPEANNKY